MNARVGSVSGIVKSMIQNFYFGELPSREDYAEVIQEVLDDNDLQIDYMNVLLDMLYRYLKQVKSYKTSKAHGDIKKYSLLYDLFRNDNRLQNNRTLKRMFDSNSASAFDYVYNFYNKLFDNYKKRIMRAAYYMLENYNNN